MAKKKKTIAQLTEVAAEVLQLLVRLKAADDNGYCSCVTCGVTRHYKDGMQGGHFITRGSKATKLIEENVHPQCDGCNGFGMKFHNKEAVYTLYMEDTYGREFVDELLVKKHQTKKYGRGEITDIIADFRARVREQEQRVVG